MKKRHKLKIIPFCISLLAVILITGGIFYYTYNSYVGTAKKFLDKYLEVGETQNIPTKDYLERILELQYSSYQLSPGNVAYRDVNTKTTYTDQKNTNIENGSVSNYCKNGIMHVAGYFDVALYATIAESTDKDGKVSYSLSYNFYFFNINHNYMNPTSDSSINPSDYIRVAFVEGVDSRKEEEYEDSEKHVGDLALEEALYQIENVSNAAATVCAPLSYQFVYGKTENSFNYYELIDWGATTPWDSSEVTYLYSSPLYGDLNNNYFDEMDNATFSIFILESDSSVTNVVEGTVSNIQTAEELIEDDNTHVGYNDDYRKIPSFFKLTWPITVGFSAAAFVVASLLASLFYLIWIDDPNKPKPEKK